MESAGIDWDNDPILNNELDERIRVYVTTPRGGTAKH